MVIKNTETRRLMEARSRPGPRQRTLAGLAHRLIYSPRDGKAVAPRAQPLIPEPDHLQPIRPTSLYLSTALELYVFVVIVVGFLTLAVLWWNEMAVQPLMLSALVLVALSVAVCGAQFSPRLGTLPLNFAFATLGLLTLGIPEAMLIGAVTGAAGHFRPRELVYPGLFKAAVFAVSMAVTGALYMWMGSTAGVFRAPHDIAALAVALGGGFAVHTVAVSTSFALSGEGSLLNVWRRHFLWTLPGLALAGVSVVAYIMMAKQLSPPASIALIVPFLLLFFYGVQNHDRHLRRHIHRVTEAHEQVHALYWNTLDSLAGAIDAKDPDSHGPRLSRLVRYAQEIGHELGLSNDSNQGVRVAALLHDIGKLGVPDHLLHKTSALTDEEEKRVREHADIGARILEAVEFPWPVAELVRAHHEQYDGSGYPQGLQGEAIPIGARILAVADAYSDMTDPRPDRPPLGAEQARAVILERSGKQFDPVVVAAFNRVWPTLETELQRAEGMRNVSDGAVRPLSAGFRDIAEANRELLALYELAQTIGSSLTTDETVSVVLGKLKRILDFTTAVLYIDDGKGGLVARGAEGEFAEVFKDRRLGPESGVSFQVFKSGEGQLVDDPGTEGEFNPQTGTRFSAALAAPVIGNDGRPVGTLTLYDRHAGYFTLDYLRLLNIIAHQAAVALENSRLFEETRTSALTDPLTGLPNARYLATHLDQELVMCRRTNRPFAVLYLDLDHFKPINDTFGHTTGDLVLQRVAHLLKSQMREYDICTRYAGDEFIAVLRETGRAAAEDAAYRIKTAIRQLDLGLPQPLKLGISVGIAYFPQDGNSLRELIDAADASMYRDKRERHAGRT